MISVNLFNILNSLKKPDACTELIYEKLMYPCWHAIPKSRPTFNEILLVIKALIATNGEFV
jgi:hypothetical protein